MSELAQFEITLRPGADPQVSIDGKELPGTIGVRIYQDERGDIPVVAIETRADKVTVKGTGGSAVSLGMSIVEFLEGIDPEQLQAEALRRGNFATPPAQTMLGILKELADGDQA